MSTASTIGAEPSGLDAAVQALEVEVAEAAGVLNAAHARLVDLTVQALDRDLWAQWGVHSPQHWLTWQAGLTPAHARQIVDVAKRVGELPRLAGAVRGGELSLDQAAAVARHCPVGFDDDVVAVAVNATVVQINQMLSRYTFTEPAPKPDRADDVDDPEPEPKPVPVVEKRSVSFWSDEDGTWHLGAVLPADEGAVLEAALVAKREDLFRRENPDVEPHSAEARAAQRDLSWADAAVALAADHLAAGDAAYTGSVIDRFCAIVHLEADPTNPDGAPVAGLHLGAALPPSLRQYLLCDGDLLPVWETKGTPVATGRKQRIVPPKVRKLVEHRDGGCRIPGCGATRWLHIHHILHWEDLGETEPENLICLCAKHHRLHHLGALPITGTASDLTICDRHGRPLQPVGRPEAIPLPADLTTAADGSGLDPVDYVHPLGEPLQTKWIDLGPNLAPPRQQEPARSGDGSRSP